MLKSLATLSLLGTLLLGSTAFADGHFDFDIYYNTCDASKANKYTCTKNTHVHQYDDQYDVTGVDMQNASLTAFNLVNAISATTTNFKVLVANQALSPAVRLQIGTSTSDPWTPAYNYLPPTASSPPPALGTGTVDLIEEPHRFTVRGTA